MQENTKLKVIELENSSGEWIGNISIDMDTMELQSHLKYGYRIRENKPIIK